MSFLNTLRTVWRTSEENDRERLYRYRVEEELAYEILGIDPVTHETQPYDPESVEKFVRACSVDGALTARLRVRCTRWPLLSGLQRSALLRDLFSQKANLRLQRAKKILGGSI